MKAIASFWQIYQLISQCGRSPWKSFRVIGHSPRIRDSGGGGAGNTIALPRFLLGLITVRWLVHSIWMQIPHGKIWLFHWFEPWRAALFLQQYIIYDYQEKKMAALSGKPLANLTKETLTKMCIDQSFDVFYPITLPARAKAWLAIQRLQENDALRPGWRLVS